MRRYHTQGPGFDYQAEWQAWIGMESRKRFPQSETNAHSLLCSPALTKKFRIALFLFHWEVQQATLFGREMCQTVFDLRVQLPCEEFLWGAMNPEDWLSRIQEAQQGQGFLDTLKIFLDVRRQPPALPPVSLCLILHGLIAVGLDLQQRPSPTSPNGEDSLSKQARISRGLDIWRVHFDEQMGPVLVHEWYQKAIVMYHMAHITLHANRQSLFAAAGDRRFLRRNSDDFYRAKQELQQWTALTSAQLATWHAVQILMKYLGDPGPQVYQQDLYVCWSTYVASLICWAYGQGEGADEEMGGVWGYQQDASHYLQNMNTPSWETLVHVNRQIPRRAGAVLEVVRDEMKHARWGFVQEAMENLKRLVLQRGGGKSV